MARKTREASENRRFAVWTMLHNPRFLYVCCVVLIATGARFLSAQGDQPRQDNSDDPPPKMGLIRDVGVSADGKLVLAGDENRVIWVWDVSKRKLVRAIQDRSPLKNPCFAFSADGKFAVVGYRHDVQRRADPMRPEGLKPLAFWDLTAGVRLRDLALENEPVYAVAISPNGKRVISVSHCKTIVPEGRNPMTVRPFEITYGFAIRLWDTSSGRLLRTLLDDGGPSPVAFTRGGQLCASGRVGAKAPEIAKQPWTLEKWETDSGQRRAVKSMAAAWRSMELACMSFSPDGKLLAIGHSWGASLWNLQTGQLSWNHGTHVTRDGVRFDDWPVTSVAFSLDGKRVVAAGGGYGFLNGIGCSRGGMVVLDTMTGKIEPDFISTKEWVRSVSFMPDGKVLVGASRNGIGIWNAQTGVLLWTLKN
jgi:WD40 repeat protein